MKSVVACAVLIAGCAARAPVAIESPRPAPGPPTAARPSAALPEPPAARPAIRIVEALAPGASRPSVVARVRRDAARLPLARWEEPDEHSSVRLAPSGPRFIINGITFAKLAIGDSFVAFTGQSFSRGTWPACPEARPRQWSSWVGFTRKEWTAAGLDVVMSRGFFDSTTCNALPEATLRGRAAALVDGWVYALRIEDGEARSLFIVAPFAALASATEDAAESGSFSAATLPLEAHHDAAVALRIPATALPAWRTMRAGGSEPAPADPTASPLLLTIEVAATTGDALAVSVVAALSDGARRRDYAGLLDAMADGR